MKKTLAVKFEVKNGRIQLFDKDGNMVEGKNARWEGDFYCYNNQLTSLEGAPSEVGGDFYCYNNQLTSLEGAPSEVGGDFDCYNNQLTSLEGAPSEVGGGFYCYNNQLTSLEGAPSEVGGYFDCSDNQLTSLKGATKENVFGLKLKINIRIEAAFNKRGFSCADGILARIVSVRSGVKKLLTVGTRKTLYLVTDGNGNFSHGETIKQAREDLVYKTIAKFEGELPEKATVAEWVSIYRAVTGACSTGTKLFVEEKGYDLQQMFTAKEVAKAVSGRYNSDKFIALI